MTNEKLYYNNTDIEVHLGDKITYKAWGFFDKLATIVYIPGESKPNQSFGDDNYVLQFDNSDDMLQIAYFPSYDKYAHKKLKFISRSSLKGINSDEEFL